MLIARSSKELLNILSSLNRDHSVGFVPTMGALHPGHLSLVNSSIENNDITVCDIFVNPTQFNNPDDYKNYPVTIDEDIQKLRDAGVDILFLPTIDDIYPEGLKKISIPLGVYNEVMEGQYRPGHFDGVVTVVKKLFDLVKPTRAYFGEKDYQQLCVIRKMVEFFKIPVEIIACPTVREKDGLAMSSRNLRLSPEGRKLATQIYKAMVEAKEMFLQGLPSNEVAAAILKKYSGPLEWEYFEIRDENTFLPVENKHQKRNTSIICGCLC